MNLRDYHNKIIVNDAKTAILTIAITVNGEIIGVPLYLAKSMAIGNCCNDSKRMEDWLREGTWVDTGLDIRDLGKNVLENIKDIV